MPDFISFQTIQKFHRIAYRYNPVSTDKIITIVDNNPTIVKAQMGLTGQKVWVNGLLEELHVKSRIRSLKEVALPEYDTVDPQSGMLLRLTETERVTRTLNYEWETDRFELRVYCAAANGQWVEYGAVALKNSGGHRYRIHRLLDLITENVGAKLGDFGKIGFQILNAGYGYPQVFDEIDITGHWTQEICIVQGQPPYAVVNNYTSASSTATPTPTPTPTPITYNPTAVLSLPTGKANVGWFYATDITLNASGFPPNTVVTLTWLKDGVATSLTDALNSGTSGSFTKTCASTIFNGTKQGTYKARLTYGTTTVETGAITVVDDSPKVGLVLPTGVTQAKMPSNTNVTATLTGFRPGASIPVSWVKGATVLSTSNVTIAADGTWTTSFGASTFRAAPFTGAGTYKLRAVQDSVTYESANLNVVEMTVLPNTNTTIDISGTGSVSIVVSGLTQGDTVNTQWLKAGVLIGTATQRTADSLGDVRFSITASAFNSSPFTGVGDYKLRATKDGFSIDSATITATTYSGGSDA